MYIAADTHVHIYPSYDLTQSLKQAFRNLNASIAVHKESVDTKNDHYKKVIFLTESRGFNFFDILKNQNLPEFNILPCSVNYHITIESKADKDQLTIINGRQFVSDCGLEVLGLGYHGKDLSKLATEEIISAINEFGAVPVLSWSPGKWLLKRGEKVKKIISESDEKQFLIGDISIRSILTPEPSLFSLARSKGFKIVAGSDPLSGSEESDQVGRYICIFNVGDDFEVCLDSTKELLMSQQGFLISKGRNGIVESVTRWTGQFLKQKLSKFRSLSI